MALYEVGDIVEYEPFGGSRRLVLVTARYDHDVKRGLNRADCSCRDAERPGFDGQVVGTPGDGVWGYDSQIRSVWRATAPIGVRS